MLTTAELHALEKYCVGLAQHDDFISEIIAFQSDKPFPYSCSLLSLHPFLDKGDYFELVVDKNIPSYNTPSVIHSFSMVMDRVLLSLLSVVVVISSILARQCDQQYVTC